MKDTRLDTIKQCRRDCKNADDFMACIAEDPNMESVLYGLQIKRKNRKRKYNRSKARLIAPMFKDAVRLIADVAIKNTKKGTDKYKKDYVMGKNDPKQKTGIFKRLLKTTIKGGVKAYKKHH